MEHRCTQYHQLVPSNRTTPGKAREETTLDLQRAPSWPTVHNYAGLGREPRFAKLARLPKEISSGKAREEIAPNKTKTN